MSGRTGKIWDLLSPELGGLRRRGDETEASFRVVPPAITPISAADLAAGVEGQIRGGGREGFREAIRSFLGGESAATYTSFRRALAACLQTLGRRGDGSGVLVPSFCSSDYPETIEAIDLETRRYDVDPATLGADLDSLRQRSFDDVSAVIAINVLGYSSRMDELASLCSRRGVPLVEALGYGLGASYEGRPLGTYGDCSVLNFQQGKPIPVGGGMVVSRRPELSFSDAGREAVSPNAPVLAGYALFSHPYPYGLYARVGERVISTLGRSSTPTTHPDSKRDVDYSPPFRTMSDFQGAVGHRSFRKLSGHRRQRAETAGFYGEKLRGIEALTRLEAVDGLRDHQFVRYPVLADTPELRDRLVTRLRDIGIQAGGLYDWPPIDSDEFPGGATLQARMLALPTHPYVTLKDRKRAVREIERVVGGVQTTRREGETDTDAR